MSALWTSDEVAKALSPIAMSGAFEATGVTFDSRAVGKGDIFFALAGETTDGHQYVADALSRDAAAAVVSRDVPGASGNLIRVPDTLKALVDLGRAGRARSTACIASVTGYGPLLAVALGGIAGGIIDSIAGAALQALRWCPACKCDCETRRHACGSPTVLRHGVSWIENDAVNFLSTLSGAADSFDATVDTASISTPVPGFSAQLAGPEFLNSKSFPQARFKSTRFTKIDPTHARVEGEFTLLGKSAPLTLNVELIGAGKGFMGHPRLGAEATGILKTADFGLPAVLGPTIHLVIDAEFARTN